MPSQKFVVAFSDVVRYAPEFHGRRRVGWNYDHMLPAPTKSFDNEDHYNAWSRGINNVWKIAMRCNGKSYRQFLAEKGYDYVPKDEFLNVLRFGELWCIQNIPPATMRTHLGDRVPMPKAEFMDEDDDYRVTE